MALRIALAGGGQLAAGMAGPIDEAGHELAGILVDGRHRPTLAMRVSRALAPQASTVFYANRRGIPVFPVTRMHPEELAPIEALGVDVILVGGFGIIFKQPILNVPRLGCVNCHSSLLPRHRGPNPFSAVILANEPETGVSFHVMTEGIDDGDVLAQQAVPLSPSDTAGTVFGRCCALAADMVADVLDAIEVEGLAGTPQDLSQATYDQKLTDEERRLDWRKPAEESARLVRACWPFTPATLRIGGKDIFVRRATALSETHEETPGRVLAGGPGLRVAAGAGVLQIDAAHTARGLPWPAPWNRPRPGYLLPS